MKRTFLKVCLISAVFITILLPACSGDKKDTDSTSKVVPSESAQLAARVNGTGITQSELERTVIGVLIQNDMDASHVDEFMNQIGPRVLDQIIQTELLYQEAVKNGNQADPEKVDEVISELSGRYDSAETFHSEMAARGLTDETLREGIVKQLTIQKYIEETIVPTAVIPEELAKAAYDSNPDKFVQPEKVKASHILVKSEETDPQEKKDAALEKATRIAALARQDGADFAELAREHSEGPSASSGGDLGYFERGRMVKPFEEKAFSMKPAEISDPVLTKFGYHIIRLDDRTESRTIPFEEVKDKLTEDLKNRLIGELVNRKVNDLKQAAQIDILFMPSPANPEGVPQD